jgi:hypothetical protein
MSTPKNFFKAAIRILQVANSQHRKILSVATLARLLESVNTGDRVAWGWSSQTTHGYGSGYPNVVAICFRRRDGKVIIGEEPLAYAPEPRLIPPAEIPKRAAKAPRKMIKAERHKMHRLPIVVLPQQQPPISDSRETPPPGETRATVRGSAYDAIADALSRRAAILRREVLCRVLGPTRKSRVTRNNEPTYRHGTVHKSGSVIDARFTSDATKLRTLCRTERQRCAV